jgi:TetR/AcrR family transcriptional regulator, lmrAB and yxaGH operons repressor
MIAGAARLPSLNGLQRTSFSEVLDLTGAPRGSVYHHFPGGKTELITAAVELVGRRLVQALESKPDLTVGETVRAFSAMWRQVLVGLDLRGGCAVAAVTMSADDPVLLEAAAAVFRTWTGSLAGALRRGGLTPTGARRLATTVIASTEGALLLSRAERTMKPFDDVAAQLVDLAAMLEPPGG